MHAFEAYVNISYVWNSNLCQNIELLDGVQGPFTRRIFWKCGFPRVDYLNRLNVVYRQNMERSRFATDLTIFYSIFNNYVECNILKDFELPANLLNL